ncbi:MAG TPA: energy transducer TonB [Terriglobales bacterium]|nr:energy transducer TonB [Terriglobales bacterium]
MTESFGLLPLPKPRWHSFLVSWGGQTLALAVLLNLNLIYPPELMSLRARFAIRHLVATPPPVPQEPQPINPKLLPKVRPVEKALATAELDTPRLALPKPPRQEPAVKAPDLDRRGVLLPQLPTAKAPKVVATNLLSTGTSLMATTTRPPGQVQTGGFGDPFGVPAKGTPGRASNINAYGSWGLPAGPGQGAGTGGARGVPGVPASAGFGRGVAVPPAGTGPARGEIRKAGFGDARPLAEEPKPRQRADAPKLTPVEVLFKPKPVYTEEGRQLKIEGAVELEVLFTAAGKVQVLRVVRGLGHGLDEAAMRAAEQIRFKPAQHEGQSVDSRARLYIVFQLA